MNGRDIMEVGEIAFRGLLLKGGREGPYDIMWAHFGEMAGV